ncbi:hypothetical protein HNQ81_002872 [Desulfoprunum benzoelyticum]|uniref:Uncharacterized protein n=1 Tax=Desulfoprunum benzoelyticum TaxID=1506996 RepID=A0A840V809_9BACT|nr:hypothetical protein [Desulfoprunum benzoelyticum]
MNELSIYLYFHILINYCLFPSSTDRKNVGKKYPSLRGK